MPGFREVCTIRANLSGLERGLKQITSPTGEKYWQIEYTVEIFFGRTTLGACVVWKEGVRPARHEIQQHCYILILDIICYVVLSQGIERRVR